MFRIFVPMWLLLSPVIVMAETRIDMNRQKDFSQYKTFTVEVLPPVRDGEVDGQNTIGENRLRQAVTEALRARGLSPTDIEAADVVVRVGSRETERTELVRSWPAYPYGSYRPWGYGYWGAHWGGDNVWTYRYIEGTMRIDVIERGTGDLVYRAEVTDDVDEDEDDRVEDAMKDAHKAFKKFPARGMFIDD
jgi:hypothetical protein